MRFIDPRTDFAFKKIFGSTETRDVLISLLEAVMGLTGERRLAEVTLLNPYEAPRIEGFKLTYLDVKCKDHRGVTYVVEMQVENHPGFLKRVAYNASKAYVNQLRSGENYPELNQVVAISILDFIAFPDLEPYVTVHTLREEMTNKLYLDEVRYYFVELPKMTRREDELRDDIDRWAYFMKTAGKLDHVPLPLSAGAFGRAFDVAEVAKMSEPEFEAYEGAAIKLRMEVDKRRVAREEGRAEGLAAGMEKGRVEGLRLAASRLLATGMPASEVATLLGIDEATVAEAWDAK